MTAVTTAGLLAGLFGSAFVPVANGAGRTSGDATVKAKYTEVTVEATGDVDAIGTSTSKFQVESSLSSAGGRTVDGTVLAGDHFVWNLFTAGAAGAGTTALVVGPGDTLKATSSNSAVVVAWAYDNAGTPDTCNDLDGVDTTNTDGAFSASDSVTDVVPFGTDYTADNAGTPEVDTNGDDYKADSDYVLCVAAKTAASAGTSTITVSYNGTTAGSITVTAVGPVASLTASIADGYKYIAEDNDILGSWIKVVAKDAAGTVINGAANSASALGLTLEDDEASLPENAQGEIIEAFLEDGTALTDANPISASLDRYSVAAGVCAEDSGSAANPEGDGDAGKSYSFKFVSENDVVSNAITITCTLNSDGARITKITPEATTGDLAYDDGLGGDDLISVVATVVDAAGRPLGDGADAGVDFNETAALAVVHDAELAEAITAVAFVGGEYEVFTIETLNTLTDAGRYAYSITLSSIDLSVDAGDEIEKKYSFAYYAVDGEAYTATISRTMNKAKTQATITADMGPELGMTAITFTAELPSGATRTYKRKANADGIAVLRLNMRNRIVEVYAVDGNDAVITDPITVRFR